MVELSSVEKLFICSMNENGGFSMLHDDALYMSFLTACVMDLIELKYIKLDDEGALLHIEKRYDGAVERLKNTFNNIIILKNKRYRNLLKAFMKEKKAQKYLYRLLGIDCLKKGFLRNMNSYDKFFPIEATQWQIVNELRPYILNDINGISKDDALFIMLLTKCKQHKIYFNKTEAKQVEEFVKKIELGEKHILPTEVLSVYKILTANYGSVSL